MIGHIKPHFKIIMICFLILFVCMLLESISTDLVIKTKSISHALIGGVFPYS
jgi:hypothetical protein